MTSPIRLLGRTLAATVASALVITVSPAFTTAASADDLPPGREIVTYTVQPGDTATGLAVEYHAWTKELISYNNLGPNARLRVGQKIKIPVVTSAARKAKATSKKTDKKSTKKSSSKKQSTKQQSTRKSSDPTRAEVRRIIIKTAREHGVDPYLALAISWQEAGWRMHHVSSANAIGVMQVLPGTGEWMELYAGERLNLRNVHDNVAAGVLLLMVLDRMTSNTSDQIAAYYQGIGAVRRDGWYSDTERYVENVKALRSKLRSGWNPA